MTNEILLILLGLAVLFLGVAGELAAPVDRLLRIAAAVLGVVVLVAVLVR